MMYSRAATKDIGVLRATSLFLRSADYVRSLTAGLRRIGWTMKTTFTHAHFRWLTDTDAPSFTMNESEDVPRQVIPMPPEVGHGWIEMLHLALGMDVSRGIHHFTPDMAGRMAPFVELTAELTAPTLCVQSALRGRVFLRDRRSNVDVLFGNGRDLFQNIDRLDMVPSLDASTNVEVTMLKIGAPVLDRLLGEESRQPLLAALGVAALPSARVIPVPAAIRALLHASLDTSLAGPMRKLHAQAKILEYICALVAHLAGQDREAYGLSPERALVRELRDELLALDGKVPTLDELADRHAMSAKTLNEAFKREYGASIFAFVAEQRLTQAHATVLETDLPMKRLADRLGYSHVNHFITAFKRKFGYPPGSLRRKSGDERRLTEEEDA
jgi:AraC-like DNA-binding protein